MKTAMFRAALAMLFVVSLAPSAKAWYFYETSCKEEAPGGPPCSGGFYFTPPLPFLAAEFVAGDASGTYSFFQSQLTPTPLVMGDDDFSFIWLPNPDNSAPPPITGCFFNPNFIDNCMWDVTWSQSPTALSISVDYHGALNTNIDIGNTGGMIGSDGFLTGCGEFAECYITGVWTLSEQLPLAEPSSFAILSGGLTIVVLFAVRRLRRATSQG
jgi:hypothetical protein